MKKSIKVDQKKKRGRPATGRGTMVSSRLPPPLVGAVDDWALRNETTRSDAIRRLVEMGLSQTREAGPCVLSTAKEAAARAEELAAKAIGNRSRLSPSKKR
jgi:hypothetical protein